MNLNQFYMKRYCATFSWQVSIDSLKITGKYEMLHFETNQKPDNFSLLAKISKS